MRSVTGRRLLVFASLVLSLALVAAACGDDEAVDDVDPSTADDASSSDPADGDDETASNTDDADPDDSDAGEDETAAETADDPEPADDTADNGSDDADTGDAEELFPDVVGATADQGADGTWTFSATLSSPYDTPDRYADAWRVVGPDGEVYGIRELAHDHANEQPFTRSQSGIVVPDGVTTVTVEGRDQVSGWGGATVEVDLDG
ncbi:MAG: hypothetical protein AAFO29_21605 [Actinomycetota bacterium]